MEPFYFYYAVSMVLFWSFLLKSPRSDSARLLPKRAISKQNDKNAIFYGHLKVKRQVVLSKLYWAYKISVLLISIF